MPRPPLISPNRLLAWYQSGAITRKQWLGGMRLQLLEALREISEDTANPQAALMERTYAFIDRSIAVDAGIKKVAAE